MAKCKAAQCAEAPIGKGVKRKMDADDDKKVAKKARSDAVAGGLTAGKRLVHASHQVVVTRGLAWRQVCGSYASVSLCTKSAWKQLAGGCRAPTKARKYCLARLAQGKTPKRDMVCWPDGAQV